MMTKQILRWPTTTAARSSARLPFRGALAGLFLACLLLQGVAADLADEGEELFVPATDGRLPRRFVLTKANPGANYDSSARFGSSPGLRRKEFALAGTNCAALKVCPLHKTASRSMPC